MDKSLRDDGGNCGKKRGEKIGFGRNLLNCIVRDICTVVCFLAHSLEESTAVKSWTYYYLHQHDPLVATYCFRKKSNTWSDYPC